MELKTNYKIPKLVLLYFIIKILFLIFIISLPILIFWSKSWLPYFYMLCIFIGTPVFISKLIFYKRFSFVLDQDFVTLNWGLITKKSRTISFKNIQNLELVRGLLLGIFKLSIVKIWTASPSQADFSRSERPDGLIYLNSVNANWLKEFVFKGK